MSFLAISFPEAKNQAVFTRSPPLTPIAPAPDAWSRTVLAFAPAAAEGPRLEVDLGLEPPSDLPERLARLGLAGPFAVVTAHNPAGDPDTGAAAVDGPANAARTARLLDALASRGLPAPARAEGRSPDGAHREPGFAVPLSEPEALELARAFDQAGIYWWDGASFWIVPAMPGTFARRRLPDPAR